MEDDHRGPVDYRKDPRARAGYMVSAYAGKQTEHLQSVRTLVLAGLHRDALLIARTMAEGAAQLKWALDRHPRGTDQWFWYGIIEDWRQLEKNWERGHEVDCDSDLTAQEVLAKHGGAYLTEDARKLDQAGDPLPPDPYRNQWYKSKIEHIFDGAAHEAIFDGLYRYASGWMHWSPRSLALSVDEHGRRLMYRIEDPRNAAIALASAALSLLLTLQVVDEFFCLSQQARLAVLETRHSEITQPVVAEQ